MLPGACACPGGLRLEARRKPRHTHARNSTGWHWPALPPRSRMEGVPNVPPRTCALFAGGRRSAGGDPRCALGTEPRRQAVARAAQQGGTQTPRPLGLPRLGAASPRPRWVERQRLGMAHPAPRTALSRPRPQRAFGHQGRIARPPHPAPVRSSHPPRSTSCWPRRLDTRAWPSRHAIKTCDRSDRTVRAKLTHCASTSVERLGMGASGKSGRARSDEAGSGSGNYNEQSPKQFRSPKDQRLRAERDGSTGPYRTSPISICWDWVPIRKPPAIALSTGTKVCPFASGTSLTTPWLSRRRQGARSSHQTRPSRTAQLR